MDRSGALSQLAEMNAVSATFVGPSACRSVLQCDPKDYWDIFGGLQAGTGLLPPPVLQFHVSVQIRTCYHKFCNCISVTACVNSSSNIFTGEY